MNQKTAHPDSKAAALHQKAIQALTSGSLMAGLRLLEQASALDQGAADIQNDLGTAYWQAGQPAKAEKSYIRAVQLAPQNPYALNNYGAFLLEQARYGEAARLLTKAYALKPDHYEIPNNLGLLHYRRGEMPEAEKLFGQAIRLNPSWPNPYVNLGDLLLDTGRLEHAEKAFRCVIDASPGNAAAWRGLGSVCATLRRDDEAIECLQRSLSIHPGDEAAWVRLVGLLEWKNRLDEALSVIARAKKHFPSCPGIIVYEAKILERNGKAAEALALMEACYKGMRDTGQQTHPFFAGFFSELGRLYDRAGQADKAFTFFTKANACSAADPAARAIDKTGITREIAQIRAGFSPEIARNAAPRRDHKAPVFLIGFPRSGTTLLDQILSSHPGVQVAEERSAMMLVAQQVRKMAKPEERASGACYASSLLPIADEKFGALRETFFAHHASHGALDESKVFIDKFPLNILYAGLIKRVFPEAKFILALRHPCDSVLSCFMQRFELNPAMARFLDLTDSAKFYDEAFGLWDHYADVLKPDVHAIRYEDVVADFRPTVAALLDFLGLEWNDAVLEFDKTAREKKRINTPSYHQVTQKLYTRASGRWQRYRTHMEPVFPLLEPHALKHGYSMDAADAGE